MKGVHRVGLGVIDQGLSSISNAVFLVAVARVASVEEFGAVSLAYALFVFGLAVQRASLGTLTALAATVRRPPPLVVSLLGALLVLVVGTALGVIVGVDDQRPTTSCWSRPSSSTRRTCCARRDRAAARRARRGQRRAVVAVTLALLCASVLGASMAAHLVLVWLVAGALGPGGARGAGGAPAPDLVLRTGSPTTRPTSGCWARTPCCRGRARWSWPRSWRTTCPSTTWPRSAVPARCWDPYLSLFSALQVVLLPEMARLLGRPPAAPRRRPGGGDGHRVALWGGVLFLIPDSAGRELLGDTWSASRAVLMPTARAGDVGLGLGPGWRLTSYRRWRALLTLRVAYLCAVAVALGAKRVSSGDVARPS